MQEQRTRLNCFCSCRGSAGTGLTALQLLPISSSTGAPCALLLPRYSSARNTIQSRPINTPEIAPLPVPHTPREELCALNDTEGVFCHVGKVNAEESGAPHCSVVTDQLRTEPDKLWGAEPTFLPGGKRERLGDPGDQAMAKEKPAAAGDLRHTTVPVPFRNPFRCA